MKILEFFGEPLSYGGQESFIINMYKCFSKENNYTFCTPFNIDNKELIELSQAKHDEIIAFNYKFQSKLRKHYICKAAKKVLSERYDIVHIHSGSVMTLLMVAYFAKKNNDTNVIIHSHATGYITMRHNIIKKCSDIFIEQFADLFLACSSQAGKYKFPNQILGSEKFIVINNGIELERFRFNELERDKKRQEIGVVGKTVICNVGRFSKEKNHDFIIDLFYEYLKLDTNGILLLVGGEGPEESQIIKKINKYQIKDKVIIYKNRSDINELLFASDVFVFPSLYEGLGISAIEAQATSLPTICANYLPEELNVSNYFFSITLDNNPKEWAEKVQSVKLLPRIDNIDMIKKNGYDISICAKKLEDIYENINRV